MLQDAAKDASYKAHMAETEQPKTIPSTDVFKKYQKELAEQEAKAAATPKKPTQKRGESSRLFLHTADGGKAEILPGSDSDIFEHEEFDASRLNKSADIDREEDIAA